MIFDGADATGLEEDARLTAMWLWTLSTGANGNGGGGDDGEADEDEDEEGSSKGARSLASPWSMTRPGRSPRASGRTWSDSAAWSR